MSAYDKKKVKQAAIEIMRDGGGVDGECEKHNLRWWDGEIECPVCKAESVTAALRAKLEQARETLELARKHVSSRVVRSGIVNQSAARMREIIVATLAALEKE